MRNGVEVRLGPGDRERLASVIASRNSPQKHIWRAHGLKPHLVRTFKLSNDPRFVEKVRDVVGLYVDPPDRAIVLSVDEKSRIQALDRTQPGLPMKRGHAGTMTHDYKRHGTTTLFAALDIACGKVIGNACSAIVIRSSFASCASSTAARRANSICHPIIDNYAAHKAPAVKRWLTRHPRFHIHFTPTSASWLNLVERFFAEITNKRIRRGVFHSVIALQQAIYAYIDAHNADPVPFVWTAAADRLIGQASRRKQSLDSGH